VHRRYFLQQWPELCYFACDNGETFGVVVGKLEPHKSTGAQRGYIGMLVVTKPYRGLGVGALASPPRASSNVCAKGNSPVRRHYCSS
jgi:GNAT superfamily N-acetyltransferase